MRSSTDSTHLLDDDASKFRELADSVQDSRDQLLDVLAVVLGKGHQGRGDAEICQSLKTYKNLRSIPFLPKLFTPAKVFNEDLSSS